MGLGLGSEVVKGMLPLYLEVIMVKVTTKLKFIFLVARSYQEVCLQLCFSLKVYPENNSVDKN